jgi:hypothetical protein
MKTEVDFGIMLRDLLESDEVADDHGRMRVRSFEEAGVLSGKEGLVVRTKDAEFQITIVRSR